MVLFIIGLGLGDEEDITVKGLKAIKRSKRVYLEAYTSVLVVPTSTLESYYGCPIIIADREMVETQSDDILQDANEVDVSFLVVGDPYGATTHSDLVLRAEELGIKVVVIHNASIMNAVGCCGLQLYNYGQTVSIVFFTDTWRPDSFYHKIKQNVDIGLHTLCLVDIKVKEQSIENMARGRKIFEEPRFMTVNQCISQLLEIEERLQLNAYNANTIVIGMARVGASDQQIVCGTMTEILEVDFGMPLHSVVIAGKMHFLEKDTLRRMAVNVDTFDKYALLE